MNTITTTTKPPVLCRLSRRFTTDAQSSASCLHVHLFVYFLSLADEKKQSFSPFRLCRCVICLSDSAGSRQKDETKLDLVEKFN